MSNNRIKSTIEFIALLSILAVNILFLNSLEEDLTLTTFLFWIISNAVIGTIWVFRDKIW